MILTRIMTVQETRRFQVEINEHYVKLFNDWARILDDSWHDLTFKEFYDIYVGEPIEKGEVETSINWGCKVKEVVHDYVEDDLLDGFCETTDSEIIDSEDYIE